MSERRNIAAWTPPGGVYPAYISINADAVLGEPVVCITVREGAGTDLAAGSQATIAIPEQEWASLVRALTAQSALMPLRQFLNGIRILWNINADEFLGCINVEDREYFGDEALWKRFRDDPHKTFAGLPSQDQERIFAIIQKRNVRAGL